MSGNSGMVVPAFTRMRAPTASSSWDFFAMVDPRSQSRVGPCATLR
jgi:hypothetical protein